MTARESEYLGIFVDCVRSCAEYRPKFGQGRTASLTLAEFRDLYRADPFYTWLGLDDPKLYTAHRSAGGMTSIYRQIGIACERVFREILQDALGLSAEEVVWSYETPLSDGGRRRLSLDGRVALDEVHEEPSRDRLRAWIRQAADSVDVDASIVGSLKGAVFEVRQGYKSKDSKRQQADLANAVAAYTSGYLPCLLVLSQQIDRDVLLRYRAARWVVLTGEFRSGDPLTSTYEFMARIVGYDLGGFFARHADTLRSEVGNVLTTLLGRDE